MADLSGAEEASCTSSNAEAGMEKMTVSANTEGSGLNNDAAAAANTAEITISSALEDNIARKGKNAYYFAHAHKANGPKWDGKVEPKLLIKHSLSTEDLLKDKMKKAPSFLYHKSNITSYAFLNEEKAVKLYINMEEVGEKCSEDDIQLDWDNSSFSLVVKNFKEEDQCLSFGKLTGNIVDAKYKLKKDKIILTLEKENEGIDWHTINDKGTSDHEFV